MKTNLLLLIIGWLMAPGSGRAQPPYLTTVPYITAGLVKPVEITHAGDNRLFIVEQDGRIRIVENDTLKATPFLDINPRVLSSGNEQGLLGLAFDPEYAQNGYFFVNYTNNSGHTVISRFSVDPANPNLALAGSEVIYLTVIQPYNNHNGGDIDFGPDGYLYIPLGDGGSVNDPQNRAQNRKQWLGKVLRIDVRNGELPLIPPDNPFIADTTWLPEIWSAGVRNPWKAAFDKQTGDYWFGDVGQGTWEEVDVEPAGGAGGVNYGWRCYEASQPFITSGCQPAVAYTQPVYEYQHLSGNCSVTGGMVYRGARYGNLAGHYVFTDFCIPSLRTLKQVNDTTFNYLVHGSWPGAGISVFGADAGGELYAANLYNGHIRRIVDTTSCAPVAWLANGDTLRICTPSGTLRTPSGDSLTYGWYRNGTLLPVTAAACPVNQNGTYVVQVTSQITGCSAADTVYVQLTPNAPAIDFTLDSSYCVFDSMQYLSPSPSGGTFSGYGIAGSQFHPAAVVAGAYLIQYTYADTNGCTYRLIKKTNVQSCVGTVETPAFSAVSVAPNPGLGLFTVSFLTGAPSTLMLVTDMLGRTVLQTEVNGTGHRQVPLDLTALRQGQYLIRLMNAEGQAVLKVMLQHE